MANTKGKRFLLIGPLPNLAIQKTGGARISFSYLIDFFERRQVVHYVINSRSHERGWQKIFNPLYVLVAILKNLSKVDVLFVNESKGGAAFLFPLTFFLARIFGKKIIFRPFGSGLKEQYQASSSWRKWLFRRTVLNADIFYLQTHDLLRFFTALGGRAHKLHLPTSREAQTNQVRPNTRPYAARFIFLGQIKKSKGVALLLAAAKELGTAYTIHLYGALEDADFQYLANTPNSIYQGLLRKEEVLPRLCDYDVLVLPTWFVGEGYPGVLIEAYALGLPVITTRWKAIPEMVEEGKTGLLIEPHSLEDLVKAMRHFNAENYPSFSQHARHLFENKFNAEKVLDRVLQEINKFTNA